MDKEKLFKYCFGCSPEIFPGTVIVTPVFPVRRFGEHCRVLETFRGRLYSGITAERDGIRFAVIHCGMGGRSAGDAALLLDVTPARRMVFAGVCGGLAGCRIGDLIVCENAFNGEGFSRYHKRPFDMKEIFDAGGLTPADPGYTRDLKEFLSERTTDKASLKTGDIFTIGSIAAEWRRNVLGIEEKGFKGIDMELSAVYHAARMTGREVAGLVFVSDLPLEKPVWEELTAQERSGYNSGIRELIRLSAEFASQERRKP